MKKTPKWEISEKKTIVKDLSIASEGEFNYYNNSDGKQVHTNIEDELQLHARKDINLKSDSGTNSGIIESEPKQPDRQSKRLPYVKEIENLDVVPYHTGNNK